MDEVEKIILNLIKDFKKVDLEFAIRRSISLADLILKYQPYLISLAKFIYPMYSKNGNLLTYQNVLKWLKKVRPDLYEVIIASEKGKNWLRKQVNEIKRLIIG